MTGRWYIEVNRGFDIREECSDYAIDATVAHDVCYPDAKFIVWAHRWFFWLWCLVGKP